MIYTTNQRQFAGKVVKITDVYPYYRYGGVEMPDGRFDGHTFVRFPITSDEVVFSGEKLKEGEKFEWREQVWDDSARKFMFLKSKIEAFGEWSKIYKKVYDVACELEEPMDILKNANPDGITENGDTFVLKRVGASKVRDLIGALTEFEVPLEERKNREGVLAFLPKYDYEDEAIHMLVGKSVRFSVVGVKLDTKYTYKEKQFVKKLTEEKRNEFGDIPF